MAELTIDDVKRAAKREAFRAGVQMRLLTPRVSVHVTRWVLAHTRLVPDQITVISMGVGLAAAAAFASTEPLVVLAGLLAYHGHVTLDYVDGEVARCRGTTSARGAYLDLMADRVTFPLLVFCAGVGAYRTLPDPSVLVAAFVGAFGLLLDKEACDCWYRATAGERPAGDGELEDRYVVAPDRTGWRWWRGRLALLAVMVRGLTAFLTYTAVAAFVDPTWRPAVSGAFAALFPLAAFGRFLLVYRRGAIPRRQALL